jgi:transposase
MASFKFCTILIFVIYVATAQTPDPDPIQELRNTVVTDEQRAWIKIECIVGTPPAEIARKLNRALGTTSLSERHVLRLYSQFTTGGRTESGQMDRCGRPRTATGDEMSELVLTLILEMDGASTAEICDRVNISPTSVRTILHEIGYQYRRSRWIPHALTDNLRLNRVDTAKENLYQLNHDSRLLERIIAIDETWLEAYTPQNPNMVGEWVAPGENR